MCPPSRTRGEMDQKGTLPHTRHDPGARPHGSKLLMSFHRDSNGAGRERCSCPPWKPAQILWLAADTQARNISFPHSPAWNYLSFRENWHCPDKEKLLPWSYKKVLKHIYIFITFLGNHISIPRTQRAHSHSHLHGCASLCPLLSSTWWNQIPYPGITFLNRLGTSFASLNFPQNEWPLFWAKHTLG